MSADMLSFANFKENPSERQEGRYRFLEILGKFNILLFHLHYCSNVKLIYCCSLLFIDSEKIIIIKY